MSARFLTILGVATLLYASTQAKQIPELAREDFTDLVLANGGSLSHGPSYREAYERLSADTRLQRNRILIGAGLVMFGVGLVGMTRDGSWGRE